MKKKALIILVVTLILLTTVFFGCQKKEEVVTGPVSFDFWTTETQSDRMATIQVLIDTYTTLYPDVSINLVAVDENDLATHVQTASAAGTLPALFEAPAETAVAFGVEGILDTAAVSEVVNGIG
ncbi:MAG: sugar ABC transporter substrate-binding protein, partial [Spirochaetota bacterium]|nr:sugar ABC transporter substrate-binding protein [Spirochaetota bacterium]